MTEELGMRRLLMRAYGAREERRTVVKALSSSFFPLDFFRRNVEALEIEEGFRRLPPRLKRARVLRMLRERSSFFLEVERWLKDHCGSDHGGLPPHVAVNLKPSGYCTHCGGCCEIASGLSEFSGEPQIPERWHRVFGDGLGRGHRFCAFLWQSGSGAGSTCAIHPWRPSPCRQFEREECEFYRQHPDALTGADPHKGTKAFRRLLRLVNGR